MKKLLITFYIILLSITTFAQTTAYTTLKVCSQEYTTFNNYYIRVIEDGKETFTVDKSNYYKSSEVQNTTFYQNKYSNAFMQIDGNGRWMAFGMDNYKFIYNFCNK